MTSPDSENPADYAEGGLAERTADLFILGEGWPDWWADLVSANKVVTSNTDGRWRGGPDFAFIWSPSSILIAQKGDLICLLKDGAIEVKPTARFAHGVSQDAPVDAATGGQSPTGGTNSTHPPTRDGRDTVTANWGMNDQSHTCPTCKRTIIIERGRFTIHSDGRKWGERPPLPRCPMAGKPVGRTP